MTYPQAQDLARQLATLETEPAKMLKTMCAQTGCQPTFIIMRYGDPHTWGEIPTKMDGRASKISRPKTIEAASKIAQQVLRANVKGFLPANVNYSTVGRDFTGAVNALVGGSVTPIEAK